MIAGFKAVDILTNLKEKLKKEAIGGFLITSETNVRYLTGFTGSDSMLFITPDDDFFFTDFRYVEQARQEIPWVKIVEKRVSLIKTICAKLKRLNTKKLYVESSYFTFGQYTEVKSSLKRILIVPTKGIIEKYRKRKTPEEIKKIQTAIDIAEKAFLGAKKKIKTGMSEKKLADILEFEIRGQGGERSSFEIICAVGSRSSLPHARATNKEITDTETILVDWGARFQFYNSDLTRVILKDRISPKFREVYQIVLDAQRFAMEKVMPGRVAKEVDLAARNYIGKKGFEKCFGHGVGHGVGLDVHEGPTINKRSKEILEAGMVFTIEPGIYVPGWGGIRIEDIVLVTPSGCDILTRVPKNLSDICL